MTWSGQRDPLSQRLSFILTAFHDVVGTQQNFFRTRLIVPTFDDPIVNLLNTVSSENTPESLPNTSGLSRTRQAPLYEHSGGTQSISKQRSTSNAEGLGLISNESPHPDNIILMSGRAPSLASHDSMGEGEIDFDAFWNMPTSVTPGSMVDPNNTQALLDSGMVPLYESMEFGVEFGRFGRQF